MAIVKPETLERRRAAHAAKTAARRAEAIRRANELAARDGPGSFWAEYAAQLPAIHANE